MQNNRINPLFLLLPILLILPFTLSARKIKQTHKIEINKGMGKKSATASSNENQLKTVRIFVDSTSSDVIRFSGYDKPAKAKKESFHITNNSDSIISKVGIRLTYLDLQNRMLHAREAETDCIVPPGETRITSIESWDQQQTFFYHLGPEPKMTATPYKVKIELLWFEH